MHRFKGIHIVSRFMTNLFSLGNALAITVCPFVFYLNKNVKANVITRNHESIHIRQQMECAVVGMLLGAFTGALFHVMWLILPGALLFYALYFAEFIFRLIQYGNTHTAYREISFEREAYMNANLTSYIYLRKPFSWIKYISY